VRAAAHPEEKPMFHRGHLAHRIAAAAAVSLTGPLVAALPCDADLDNDGTVGVTDFLDLLALWGTDPAGPPDFNDDGTVGVEDFLTLLAQWGPIAFDFGPQFPHTEAHQIGLEMMGAGGPLVLPPDIYDRIVFDLALIRGYEPALAPETHSMAWLPNQLLVDLVPAAPQDEFECLNEQYQVIEMDNIFGTWWLLTFAGKINVPALGEVYQQTPAVNLYDPNWLIGGQNYWVPTDLGNGWWLWEIDDGWWDCFDGCDCHRLYTFRTGPAGQVILYDYQEVGQSWCEF
jgi:hypothetical protein